MTENSTLVDGAPNKKDKGPKKKRLSPAQSEMLEIMTQREGTWAPAAVFLCVLNHWILPRSLPTGETFTRGDIFLVIVEYSFYWLILLSITTWILWSQSFAVDFATRDNAPIKDAQGTNDTGWTIWMILALTEIFGTTVMSVVLRVLAPGKMPANLMEDRLIIHPMIAIYLFFIVFALVVDYKMNGPMFQRINSLRQKFIREEV
jgi:hypothetical protein